MVMFTGKTINMGVIGNPIAHSLSPAMQNAGIQAAGLDYAYIAMPVLNENLRAAVEGLKALGFRGFNVTIPHKQAIMDYLDEIDEDAKIIGAVNAVKNENGYLTGYNTDVTGFVDGMKQQGFSPSDKNAVLLGAGGAARAIIWGLIKEKVSTLTIGVRNVAKVQPVANYFSRYMRIEVLDWHSPEFAAQLSRAQLLINSTPLGMTPNTDSMPPVDWEKVSPDTFVYDIIYTPAETIFLKTARERGCQTLNGEAMLVGQGAEAFRLWTGLTLPQAPMAAALRAALCPGK